MPANILQTLIYLTYIKVCGENNGQNLLCLYQWFIWTEP